MERYRREVFGTFSTGVITSLRLLWLSNFGIYARIGAARVMTVCFLANMYLLRTREDITVFEAAKQKLSLAFGGNTDTET